MSFHCFLRSVFSVKLFVFFELLGEEFYFVFQLLELDEAKALIKELEDKVKLLTEELKKHKQLNRKNAS